MRTMVEDRKADLAESMVPTAAHVVCLVHGDGGPEDLQTVFADLNDDQRTALIVVLAGMVDPGRPIGAALGWADGPAPAAVQGPTIQETGDAYAAEIGLERATIESEAGYVDEIVVQAYLNGRRVRVTDSERLEAIRRGVQQRDMTYKDFDQLHRLTEGTTLTWVCRERKRAENAGRDFPEIHLPTPGKTKSSLPKAQILEVRMLAAQGIPDIELASRFGTSPRSIVRIVSGETHKDVGGPLRCDHAFPPRSRRTNAARPLAPSAGALATAS